MLIRSFDLFLRINCGFVFLFACCFTSFLPSVAADARRTGRWAESAQWGLTGRETALQQSGEVPCPSREVREWLHCFSFYSSLHEDTYSLQSGKKKKVDHYWGPICHSFCGFLWASMSELSQEYCLFRVVVAKIKWEYISGVSIRSLHVVRTCIFLSFVCSLVLLKAASLYYNNKRKSITGPDIHWMSLRKMYLLLWLLLLQDY